MGLAMSYLRVPPVLEGEPDPTRIAQRVFGERDRRRRVPFAPLDIGGTWQALHYLVTGDPWEGRQPEADVVCGGRLLTERHEPRQLEEAILGVIGAIDKPGSPAGEAKSAFHNNLYGRTPAQRQRYRMHVTEVTLDDLRRVGETYLQPQQASQAVITSAAAVQQHGDLDMEVLPL